MEQNLSGVLKHTLIIQDVRLIRLLMIVFLILKLRAQFVTHALELTVTLILIARQFKIKNLMVELVYEVNQTCLCIVGVKCHLGYGRNGKSQIQTSGGFQAF